MDSSSAGSVAFRPSRPEARLVLAILLAVDLIVLGAALFGVRGVVVLAGAAALVVVSRRWEWLLALVLVGHPLLVPVTRALEDGRPVVFGLRLLATAAVGATLLRAAGATGSLRGASRSLKPFWLALALWIVLVGGLLLSEARGYGVFKVTGFALTGLLYAGLLGAAGWIWSRSPDPMRSVRRFLQAAWLYLALIAVTAVLNLLFVFEEYGLRLRVLGLAPIWLGRVAGAGLILLPYAMRRLDWPRIPLVLLAAALTVTLMWSGSRGPVVALGLVLVAAVLDRLFLRRGAHRGGRELALLAGGVAVAAAALMVLPQALRLRFVDLAGRAAPGEGISLEMRLYLLGQTAILLPKAAWIGVGTGGFAAAVAGGDLRLYPHNIFAELLVENGLPGLLLLVAFIFMTARSGWGLRRHPAVGSECALGLALGLYALANALFSGDLPFNEGIWIWGAFVWAMKIVAERINAPAR